MYLHYRWMHVFFGHRANVNPLAIVDDGISDHKISASHKNSGSDTDDSNGEVEISIDNLPPLTHADVNDGYDSELDPEWMDKQVKDDHNVDYFAQEEPTKLLTPKETVSIAEEVIFEHVDYEMADCKNTEDMPSPEPVGSWAHFAAPTRKNHAPAS
jgi:hypothetical protein